MYLCYTDGGCRVSEHSPGGWGVFIRPPVGDPIEKFGGAINTNSTTMELTAVKEALAALPINVKATVFSDSKEVLLLCEKFIPIWRENGWKNVTPQFEPLLREINSFLEDKKLKITWTWIKSHNGNPGNERADALADQGAREAKKIVKSLTTR